MDIQKKKTKMVDIVSASGGEKEIVLLKYGRRRDPKLQMHPNASNQSEVLADIAAAAFLSKDETAKKDNRLIENIGKLSIGKQPEADVLKVSVPLEINSSVQEITPKKPINDFIPLEAGRPEASRGDEGRPIIANTGFNAPRELLTGVTEEIFKKSKKKEPLLLQEKERFNFKKYLAYSSIFLTVSLIIYASIYILPRAEIVINTKKTPWNFNDNVTASKNISGVDAAAKQIPAEIFKDVKNLTLSFTAHGKKYIERKAVGEIIIYNSYSSQSQRLIKGTRFESHDGKIFLLNKGITVPGAQIKEGKIVPSGIKAAVTAEKAGEEYNIAPENRFTLPGFKGSSKYEKFYAVSNEAMSGGFVGDILFPTEEDILAAKNETAAQLFDNMNNFLSSQLNSDFKVFEWSKVFNIIKENIDQEADKDGKFLVALEGELKIITFRESDILKLFSEIAKKTLGQNFEVKTYNLNYISGQYNVNNGSLSLNVEFKGEFWQPINAENFKNSVINKKENDLKIFVYSIPGVEKATFLLWPRWVRTVPDSAEKIKVEIN